MCVKMLNPKENESMIDTAAGSCGFPLHAILHVWKAINPNKNKHMITSQDREQKEKDYVENKVFAIDFDLNSVRIAKTLNLIAGDGNTNVMMLNTLDYKRWSETIKEEQWINNYNTGFQKLKKIRVDKEFSKFNFDILMANPPFAGDISDKVILSSYANLNKNAKGKMQNKVGRDMLFIERNLNFLKPGGRMAIALPQGRFNNSSDKHIRDFLVENCRILAVVGLHPNVFKPHTGTKTSVLFVQKWDDKLCPRQEDYKIFFATMQEPSKDNSGEKIYVKDEKGNLAIDTHGHTYIKHDLYNHDGLTQDGIAEAFIEFAKKERLSFFYDASLTFDENKYKKLLERLNLNIKTLKESFLATGRLDSEYYQGKYEELEKIIKKYGSSSIKKICNIKNTLHKINKTKTYKYIELSDIGNLGDIKSYTFDIGSKLPTRARKLIAKGDVIISSIEGSLQSVALINDDSNNILCSTGFYVLNSKLINSETLLILFKTNLFQKIMMKNSSGTILGSVNINEFQNIKIPIFPMQIQNEIQNLVQESFSLREEANTLFKEAIYLVESKIAEGK